MAKVFCSYSHRDEQMRQELQQHLSVLLRSGLISLWSDRVIMAGRDIDHEISANLESADIILALLSASYLASHYCSEIEAKRAIELHARGKAHVIPIILRDCDWHNTPFGKLLALPTDGRPIKSWPDRDRAYKIVADRLRAVAVEVNGTSAVSSGVDAGRTIVPSSAPAPQLGIYEATLSAILSRSSAVPQGDDIETDEFLPQLAELIETGDNLLLRRQDLLASAADCTINYIFDENVFELFFRPKVSADYVALFHKKEWNLGSKAQTNWRTINAQSAVLTGEYLFSGSLPGQRENKIYLTNWHRRELLNRVAQIGWGAGKISENSDMIRHFLFRMASFRAAIISGVMAEGAGGRLDEVEGLLRDAASLRKAGIPEDKINAYVWARLALHTIAEDDLIAPLLQIKRLFGGDFFSCIRSADELMPRSIGHEELRREVPIWLARFEAEFARRSLKSNSMRPHEALQNDALSLALVQHINREHHSDEVTLFVTGDSMIFSAYRRWHSETRPEEPFLLRRVAQYAPAFTLVEREVGVESHVTLIDHFLDVALFPFNLTQWNNERQGIVTSARRAFAQQIRDNATGASNLNGRELESFFPYIKADGYRTIKREIQKLGTSGREVETLLLGLNPDLLSYRIRTSLPDALLLHPDLADISAEDIESWILSLLVTLERVSLNLWLPLAEEIVATSKAWEARRVRDLRKEIEWQTFYFVGAVDGRMVQLSFRIPSQRVMTEANEEEANYPLASTDEERQLLRHPFMIFAAAAGASARRLRWDEAFRFSKLCMEAVRLSTDAVSEQNLKEAARLFELIEKERATAGVP